MNKNCPNCGAPVEHIYSHNCPYCETLLNSDNVGMKQEIDLRHINNIELCDIAYSHIENTMNLYFKGRELDIRPMYECNGIKALCFNKSQNIMFAIKIPIEDLYGKSNINLVKIIHSRVPFEIFNETMEAIIKYCKKNINRETRLIMDYL